MMDATTVENFGEIEDRAGIDENTSMNGKEGEEMFNEMEQDDQLFADESKPEFLYENMTLDQIIKLKKEQGKSEYGQRGVRYGMDDTSCTIRYCSPVLLLKLLSRDGKLIEMEAKELNYEQNLSGLDEFRAHRWRVVWSHEGVQGIGDAPRKMMASHVAALDLCDKLRVKFPEYNLIDCEIPRGTLVNPFVFKLLDDVCLKYEYDLPEYQMEVNLNANGRKEFRCICHIEDEMFMGKSFDGHFAKRFAAKKAYEALTGLTFADDAVIKGKDCHGYDQPYVDLESEANHVIIRYKKQPKRARMSSSATSSQQLSRAESTSSLESSTNSGPQLRPPRLRPPPIVLPKSLEMKLNNEQNKIPFWIDHDSDNDTVSLDEDVDEPTSVEVENPEAFGEISDVEDEFYGFCVDDEDKE